MPLQAATIPRIDRSQILQGAVSTPAGHIPYVLLYNRAITVYSRQQRCIELVFKAWAVECICWGAVWAARVPVSVVVSESALVVGGQ